MRAMIFVRQDDLLKASHYKRINVAGHMHDGHWVDTYSKNVLVADDHEDLKVANGGGSFYQKQAHKKLAAKVKDFHIMEHGAKASLVLAYATDMQKEASASAAISGFKASILAGKVPSPSQYAAYSSASQSVQQAVGEACMKKVGVGAFEDLVGQAGAKTKPSLAPIESAQSATNNVAPDAGPTVDTPVPAKLKATLDGWHVTGNNGALEATIQNNAHNPHVVAYAQKLLDKLDAAALDSHGEGWDKTADGKGVYDDHPAEGETLKDWPGTKFVLKDGAWEAHHATGGFTLCGPELSAALFIKVGKPVPYTVADKLSEKSKAAIVKDAAADFGISTMDAQALMMGMNHPDPWNPSNLSEGDTKVEDGKTYVLKDGHWNLVDDEDHAKHKAAVAAFETGAFYQKEALKKLKSEHGDAWHDMHPAKQHELAQAKYQALQGAASQAAAVSGWKKHMLAGQVPTLSEVKAFAAMATEDSNKAGKLLVEVQNVIGGDKLAQLVAQAHAKAAKASPVAGGAAPEPVAKPAVVVTRDATAKPKNEAKDKLSQPLQDFVMLFKFHGGPIAQGQSVEQMMGPEDIAAFKAATSDEKTTVAAAISFYGPHKLKLFMDWLQDYNANAAAQKTGPVPVTSNVYTNTTEGHKKFWSVSVHGTKMKTTYGKLGTQGSTTTKDFSSAAAAVAAANKLKGEKVAKGYQFGYTGVHQYDGQVAAPAKAAPAAPAAPVVVTPHAPAKVAPSPASGWGFTAKNEGMSGVQTLDVEAPNGDLITVAKTDDGYQVINGGPDGTGTENYSDYGTLAEAMDQVVGLHGVAVPPLDMLQKLDPSYQATGPKEGDTKQGADGMLVFKNGRWHKAEDPNAIKLPDFSDDTTMWGLIYTKAAKELQAAFESGGVAAVKKLVTVHKVGSKAGKFGATLGGGKFTVGPNDASPRRIKMHAFIKALLESKSKGGGKVVSAPASAKTAPQAAPQAAPKPAGTAKPSVSAPTVKTQAGKPPITVADGWTQTGPQKGSNPGGRFKDKNGQEWYCKFPADVDVAMNELLAAKFYEMLGVAVPSLKLVEQGGKIGIASKWVDGISKGTPSQLSKAPGAHDAFPLDAWLANWDVVGLGYDNLMLGKDGHAVRVDVGGSLVYRAQGGKKGDAFGDTVPELETLLDPKTNDKSASVFGGIKPGSMGWGLSQLNKMKPSQIIELCQKAGPGSDADKVALANKLIARRAHILAKFGVRDQWAHIKALDPSNLPVNKKDLPKPIDFANLNGPGKGLSSKAHVNEQNTKDSAAMIAFAAKGNLIALKGYQYDAVNKETGAPLGKKSIIDHPSKQIKEQWAGLIELLQSISTPPLPTLEMPSMGAAGSIEEISDFVGMFHPEDRVETVAAEHRMGFFMQLGQIDDVHDLVRGFKWSYLKAQSKFVQDCKAGFPKLSSAVRAYIGAVQASGWINHVWSQGKPTVDASGNNGKYSGGVQSLASKIYADAVDLPEGTVLHRGMTDKTAGKSMTQQFLNAKPGLVIQNTDSMCTSYKEGWSWSGDVQLTIRCAKGCKATPSFASGNYSGEHEITTLPGQRFVVLSVEKSGSSAKVEVLMLPPHEGYVAELGKLAILGKALVVFFKGAK